MSEINSSDLISIVEALTNTGNLEKKKIDYLINYLKTNGDQVSPARDVIQIRRGNEENLPILLQGELGFTLDTEKLYIGGANGNVVITNGAASDIIDGGTY